MTRLLDESRKEAAYVMQTEAENLRRAAEKKRAEEMLAEIENKKKLREYLDESKNAFD